MEKLTIGEVYGREEIFSIEDLGRSKWKEFLYLHPVWAGYEPIKFLVSYRPASGCTCSGELGGIEVKAIISKE